jgi:filamentous hemagglutinin family protein
MAVLKHSPVQALRRALETALVSALTGLVAVGPAALARAGPEGASVQAGEVTITQTSSTDWEIGASDGSIIHYDRFDIDPGQWVRFIQDNAESRVLNRVFSENPTRILGRLSANGHVYLVNPSGVIIGDGARIDANGFHAAAGRISNEDFLARRERFTDLRGDVENRGRISGADVELDADGASVVALAGRKVTNGALGALLGQIFVDGEAGWIVLAAGTDVLITATGDSFAVQIEGALAAPGDLRLENHATLDAGRGRVGLAAGDAAGLALFHTSVGQPDGSSIENHVAGSRILVQGGADSDVSVAGTLDAHSASAAGGRIEISGTRVSVQDADLLASGATSGGTVNLSARDGGIGTRAHAEAELSVDASSSIVVSGKDGDGGSIALATEGALDYRTTDTNLDGQGDESSPGTLRVTASELIVNGSAGAGQAAISSALLAAQGTQGSAAQGANLVLEGSEVLRVDAAADLSGARQAVVLRGAVDTRAAAVTARKDLGIVGSDVHLGDLTSQTGNIAIAGSDAVDLQGRLTAQEEIGVDAGTGSTGSARVVLGKGVAFDAKRVALTQDDAIGSSALDGVAAGDLGAIALLSNAPDGSLDYALQSREGNIELRSETGSEIDLVARARRDITVADADGKLEARSADLTVEGAWQPGFDVEVDGLAALRAGAAGSGDLTVSRRIDAGALTLAAGNGTTTSTDPDGAQVVIADGAQFGTGAGLSSFRLEQDTSIALPEQLRALALASGASYELVSRLGDVAVDASQLDRVSGQRVLLEAGGGIALNFGAGEARKLGEAGSAGPLGSFSARSGDSLSVDYDVYAGEIALAAGNGDASAAGARARVLIDPLVHFGRADAGTRVAPRSFSLEQDDSLRATDVPTRDQLGALSGDPGEDLVTLRSLLGSVTLDATRGAALLENTHAVLGALTPLPGGEDDTGAGVRLTADRLRVKSLSVESDLIVDSSNGGGDDDLVELISEGNIDLAGETPDVAGTRGNLLVRSDAKLNVQAGGLLFAGRIQSTPDPGSSPATSFDAPDSEFELRIGAREVDVTSIQASGTTDRDGGDVKVSAAESAVIGSIAADGGAIALEDDLDGGTVVARAPSLRVGSVQARGGVFTDGGTPTSADGGKILLEGLLELVGARYDTREATGKGGVLELRGDVELAPPLGAAGTPRVDFAVGDLLATGDFGVGQSLATDAQLSALIAASGKIELRNGAQLGAEGGLVLSAGGDLALGDDLTAGRLIDLTVDSDGTGGGGFGAGPALVLASREIRLGAGDASSTSSDGALVAGELARFTLAGPGGSGNPERFRLVQDRWVDLDGEGTLIAADRFEGGIEGMEGMEYVVGSRRAGVALSNAAVGGTHLRVAVTGTTGTASTATPDAASGDVTVAGGTLGVASAQISGDRDLRVGFAIDTSTDTPGSEASRIDLAAGQLERGDLILSSALRADEIALIAGRVGADGSLVKLETGARLLRGGVGPEELAPRSFALQQDSSISALPDPTSLFPALGRDGMHYQLASLTGDVTLADAAAAAAVAGTALSLLGREIAIRAPLQVASLDANATGGVSVESNVTAAGNRPADQRGTWAPSHIRLHSGFTGASRDLAIGAVTLSADEIALHTGARGFDPVAGGSSRVTFAEGARLGGLPGSRLARLELEQEASFGSGGSAIPTAFIDADDLAGLDLSLRSNSGEIAVSSAAQAPLQGMALALHGARGVTLESGAAGGLSYASLLARVGSSAEGSTVPSIALHDALTTTRGELNLLGDVRLVGAGEGRLVARGGAGLQDGIVRVTGTLSRADGSADGTVGDVAIEADDEVTVAGIDVSGSETRRSAGSVQVAALAGLAEVGALRAVGGKQGDQGGNGGSAEIDGAVVRVGGIDTGAELGSAGSVALGVGLAPGVDRVPGTSRVEVGGDLSLVGQKPSETAVEQGGKLTVGAPLALRTGGGLIDAGEIELRGGVKLAGSGGVSGTGNEALRATARGRLTASGNLVAGEVALAGRGASGDLDLQGVDEVLADRISLEAGEGGADILLRTDIAFRDLKGQDHPDAFRVTQDAAIDFGGGPNQLVTRDNLVDPGGSLAGLELTLESRQGQVRVFDPAQVDGTWLALRGAGGPGDTSVLVDGNLAVAQLALGAGTARIQGELEVDGSLASAGNLEVAGNRAAIGGQVDLTAAQDEQLVRVGAGAGTLALGGDVLRQRDAGRGDLKLDARRIEFSSIRDQRIAAHGGVASDAPAGTLPEARLVFTSADPLRKLAGGLALEADTGIDLSSIPGLAPDGSPRNSVETFSGPLSLRTRSGSTETGGGLAANGGDLVADTNLDFRGALGEAALRASGSVWALQGASVEGQDLVLASGSGEIRTGGSFSIAGGDFLPGSGLVVERDTRIEADEIVLPGDVSGDPAASSSLELAASRVRLAKLGAQTLETGSLSLVRSGGGSGVLLEHEGDLSLRASSGNLSTSAGAQVVATGDLELAAAGGISLGDSAAAQHVALLSDHISVGSGASVQANRIDATGAASSGTFATPTGIEVSSELVSDAVVLVSRPGELTAEDLAGFIAAGVIPPPAGSAIGDSSDEAAIWQTAPRVLEPLPGARAAAGLATRPLRPEEVLAFLRRDARLHGGLPDVAAGDDVVNPFHERLRTPDAERAAQLYRELFRTSADDLRALFEAAARAQRRSGPLDADSLAQRIATDPAHARALAVSGSAAELLDRLRALGLTPEDYAQLRTRLLGPLAPEGLDPAAFAQAIDSL